MLNIIEAAQKEISRLEKMLKRIDMFLAGAPEGCLKWQNKNGKVTCTETIEGTKTICK